MEKDNTKSLAFEIVSELKKELRIYKILSTILSVGNLILLIVLYMKGG